MSEESITIIVDDEKIAARMGQTVMEACDAAGVYIPRLCYHPDLPPAGHCRVCTVKINGRPTNACTSPVSDGLVIENNTEELKQCRRQIIEMLFVEGNHYCPACEASGNCELQALGYRMGLEAPRMAYLRKERDLDATHSNIYIDRERCILCGRCVRASKLLDGKVALGFVGRGLNMRLAVDGVHGLDETGMAVGDKAARICPTGCLRVKREGFHTPVGKRTYDHQPIGAEIEQKHETAGKEGGK